MKTVTMHKAKSTLWQLVAEVEAGGEIIIMRGKVPAARLVGLGVEPTREFGALAGQLAVSPAFFEPLPATELLACFAFAEEPPAASLDSSVRS